MVPILRPLIAYANFKGRARRLEYWQWTIALLVIAVGAQAAYKFVPDFSRPIFMWLGGAWSLVTLIPSLAVTVRRFHDTNRTGWWALYTVVVPTVVLQSAIIAYFALARFTPNKHTSASEDFIAPSIIVFVGVIAMLFPVMFLAQDGTPKQNRFGGDPKGRCNETAVF